MLHPSASRLSHCSHLSNEFLACSHREIIKSGGPFEWPTETSRHYNMALDIIIIGAGVAGLSAAIAIKTSIPKANISIHEIRSQPSSIGGAVNLTPNALRYLSALGALDRLQKVSCPVKKIDVVSHRTGSYLGRVNFDIPRGDGFQALRVKRSFLLDSLATTWQETGGHVSYDSRAKSIQRAKSGRLVVEFHNQQSKEADVVLGCDGIHSFVRAQYVQVDRQPEYSGIATAYGIMDCTNLDLSSLSIDTTKVLSSQRGALLLSFTDVEKKELYIGAVMETEEIDSREGWKAKGANKEMIKSVILDRFCAAGPVAEKLRPVVEKMEDWFLYPVFKLPPKGRWLRDNVLVIGDAAHAVSCGSARRI